MGNNRAAIIAVTALAVLLAPAHDVDELARAGACR